MDALMIAVLVGVVAVAAVLLGWFLGSRPVGAARAEANASRERLTGLERELAVASDQAGRLRLTEETLKSVTEERDRVSGELAAARVRADLYADLETRHRALQQEAHTIRGDIAGAEERLGRLAEVERLLDLRTAERDEARRAKAGLETEVKSFEERLTDLRKSRDELITQFRDVGDKLLEKAQVDFLAKADERLHKADRESQAKLQTLLQPVSDTLKRYEEGLQRVEAERKDSYGELRGVLGELRKDNGQVRDETRNLVNALRSSPKARGRWGEQSLRNVLVQAGLTEGIDFEMEVSLETADGRLRPDVVVNLPSNRKLVIDAKCSLNAFLDACDEVDDEKRQACFKLHVASMRNHAQALGSKDYWAQFGEAADYVIMYIPGEHFLTAALEQDPQLWDWAFERRVLLATPTNLVAIARTVASVWRQEKITEQAEVIAALGKELHSRIATMAEHVVRMGRNLATANDAYNKMVGSLETQVFTQAKRFEGLGSGSQKEIASPPMIEVAPRPLTKLAPAANDEATAAE
ncbi:DNA recombination protein RmuC [Sphingomonas glaciei]|uniref:DNA recombination protein RmuC homolog n=1 Tax=Sphingomonas glaciei TaxID=2938948 RepID=A0ABY5MYY5_9SPHN|nr:DNA recombination protein RmuC [Sphingomonas glaciei]UUR08985.1 DNA recombination protein RmuC [Sphingomonas glaciei]